MSIPWATPDSVPPRPSRARCLLRLARWTYQAFLWLNGWRRVWQPQAAFPGQPARLAERWAKKSGLARYTLPAEAALAMESQFHHAAVAAQHR